MVEGFLAAIALISFFIYKRVSAAADSLKNIESRLLELTAESRQARDSAAHDLGTMVTALGSITSSVGDISDVASAYGRRHFPTPSEIENDLME